MLREKRGLLHACGMLLHRLRTQMDDWEAILESHASDHKFLLSMVSEATRHALDPACSNPQE